MAYAEALERQLEAWRWATGPLFRIHSQAIDRSRYPTTAAWERNKDPGVWSEGHRKTVEPGLRLGETYYWSQGLTPLVGAGTQLPPTTRVAMTDLPAPAGFIWFEQPIPKDPVTSTDPLTREVVADDQELAAVSWQPVAEGTHTVVNTWIRPSDPGLWTGQRLPAQLPFHAWPFSAPWAHDAALADQDQGQVKDFAEWLACMLFLKQEVVVAGPGEDLDRAARRRLERDGWKREPVVRVVRLRRVHAHAPSDDTAAVDWSCQWVVRGHWRQQPVGPGKRDRRTTWVLPYVKGPEDKPLKAPRATVFAVVR